MTYMTYVPINPRCTTGGNDTYIKLMNLKFVISQIVWQEKYILWSEAHVQFLALSGTPRTSSKKQPWNDE